MLLVKLSPNGFIVWRIEHNIEEVSQLNVFKENVYLIGLLPDKFTINSFDIVSGSLSKISTFESKVVSGFLNDFNFVFHDGKTWMFIDHISASTHPKLLSVLRNEEVLEPFTISTSNLQNMDGNFIVVNERYVGRIEGSNLVIVHEFAHISRISHSRSNDKDVFSSISLNGAEVSFFSL